MPEIPDLNIFRRNLAEKLVGRQLTDIRFLITRRLKNTEEEFAAALIGAHLTSIIRTGKELHFEFDNGHTLGLHLMLYGELHWFTGTNENKFPIAELMFSDGTGLSISDWQKSVIITLDPEVATVPDALSIPAGYLSAALGKTSRPIKTVLTDGKTVVGIGNAYVDEILYDANISPLSVANKIPDKAIKALEDAVKNVLVNAEEHIYANFPETISEKERDFLQVHRPKQTHTLKGEEIIKMDINKRSTYYIAKQKLYE
ncbi:Fpg/Nei family DNA glycosylase [Mucilaginibacter pallidiroseus]|uniref:Fpg/Nei family DNA glycosylase n=1 Tax=Mucilaginibacter pallidiroseus TaxID=2599295 RepID=A0A563U0U5_9SPHI|nr:DNA-formamidopyrimidine glycosylase family protein [Mucilaginibacter pallidiroseus]TWR25247.1 Fpg/Nei family DNA glycosylase [Mucilaginibacter pallidiroseus]